MSKFKVTDKFILRKDLGNFEIIGIYPKGSFGQSQTGYVLQGNAKLKLDESDLLELFSQDDPFGKKEKEAQEETKKLELKIEEDKKESVKRKAGMLSRKKGTVKKKTKTKPKTDKE